MSIIQKFFYSCLILVSTFGCAKQDNNQKNTIVAIQNVAENIVLENLISFVRLEKSDQSIVDKIMNIEITDKYIYILDKNTLFFFDTEGTFIKKLIRGKGPGEILKPINFSFNNIRKEIYVLDGGNLMHIYDEYGVFIDTHVLKGTFGDVMGIDKDNILLLSVLPARYIKNKVFCYNIPKKEITKEYIPVENLFSPNFEMLWFNHFCRVDNSVYLAISNSRDIYLFHNNAFDTICSIDFGKMNPESRYLDNFQHTRDYIKQCKDDNSVDFIRYFYKFEDFTLIGYNTDNTNVGLLFNEQDELYGCRLSEILRLPSTESFDRPLNAVGNKLVFAYYNDLLFSDDPSLKSAELHIGEQSIVLDINDNPIIVLVELI